MNEPASRIALLTGADSGLGSTIAHVLRASGWRVVGITREASQVSACEWTYVGDLRALDRLDAIVDKVESEVGPVTALVNNAGVRLQRRFLDTSAEDLEALLSVNFKAAYFLSQAVARRMIARRGGSIVNIASQLGIVAGSDHSAYGVSKAAVVAMTRSLAVELARSKIAVNAVAPGPTNTAAAGLLKTEEEAMDFLMRIPLGRRVESAEVAAAVRYLCELDGAAITGQVLAVDGGWTLI